MGIKAIVGLVLLAGSFGYLVLNPGQSMMDGLMKQKKEKYEAMKAENDFELPSNADELKIFAADLQKRYGVVNKSETFAILPLYCNTESADNSETDSLWAGH